MRDEDKTKEDLINELVSLRQHFAVLKPAAPTPRYAEESVITLEERFRSIFENTIVGIYQSLPEGRYITVNSAFARIFGYDSPAELLRSITNIGKMLYVNTDERDKCIDQVLKKGFGDFEIQVYRKDGCKAWVSNYVRVVRDEDGNIVCFEGMTVDITQRKKAEDQLFYNVFKASPAAMSINLISDYSFIDVNKRFTEITGYTSEEAIGMTPAELGLFADKREIAKILKSRKYGTVKNVEITLRRKTGEERAVLFSSVLMNIKNETCILCMALDNTELMHYQNEMARFDRLNLIGEMAAGLGHEVRNPMTTVRGFLQLFKGKKEFSRYTDQLDLMVAELDRANSIITEFLSLGKNRAIDLKKQNLNNIVNSLYPLIQAGAMEKDKNALLELEDIPMLLLDGKEIRQVILNLVRNGLEATPPGGNITIRTFKEEGEVVLSVRDQGAGIDSDVLEKIGTPFFTTKETGTGLGLAVCYSIAAKHNAAISIDTGIKGTTFDVRFKQTKNN